MDSTDSTHEQKAAPPPIGPTPTPTHIATLTPPPSASQVPPWFRTQFKPIAPPSKLKPVPPSKPPLSTRSLLPAPPRQPPPREPQSRTCFYDLPAELRIEIYKLVLEHVTIHIVPPFAERSFPHPLVRTSRQVRNEVLPMIQSLCQVRATITDFNFDGILAWLARIPPHQHANLTKNKDLRIRLCTTLKPTTNSDSLRRWLHLRADPYRPQPDWQYSGPNPKAKVANDLRRRAKRMTTEPRKQAELVAMLGGIGVTL